MEGIPQQHALEVMTRVWVSFLATDIMHGMMEMGKEAAIMAKIKKDLAKGVVKP